MSETAVQTLRIAPPAAASARTKAATVAAVVAGPAACAALLLSLDAVWPLLVQSSNAATAALYEDFETVRRQPGVAADAIRLVLGAALAAVPPALGMGAFERHAAGRALVATLFYPAWLVVMLAPAAVLYRYSSDIDPTLLGARLPSQFLVLFSAAATSIALGYAVCARRRPRRPAAEDSRLHAAR